LSWQPDDRCDSFTKKAILAGAPTISGVSGLYNLNCQVFIGESDNIQESLLRHESETDFQSRHLQPTGFTFEPCATELRKPKAAKLIARFRPVLQTKAELTETCSQSNGPMGSKVILGGQVRRDFHFKGRQRDTFAAIFVASAAATFYLGIPAVQNIQRQVYGADRTPLARISMTLTPPQMELGLV
jgi:hypothetical protein